jgi:HK97 family phage prohead protease
VKVRRNPMQKSDQSRFLARLENVECRESGNGEEFTLTGYAAVFDKGSEDLVTFAGTFREKIAPGAFTDVLGNGPDVRLLYNHDGLTLARTKSGTLELSEDEQGLRVWARLAPTQTASDLRMAMQRGDVDQMSFAFTIGADEWKEDQETEEVERTITRIDELYDVSVVSFPAYPDTEAVMRELRSAAADGKITARETAGEEAAPGDAETVADGQDADAEAETDPPAGGSALEELKERSQQAVAEANESHMQIKKDITR